MLKARKQIQQPTNPPPGLDVYLGQYDAVSLQAMLTDLHRSPAWEVMRAFLRVKQREFEIAALDLVRHANHEQEAAHASGYAQACEDMADRLMQEFVDKISGKSVAVFDSPKDVDVEDHPPVEA